MWAIATALIDGNARPCLALDGRLYPFAALRAELPATTTALFADWPAAAATLQNEADLIAAGQGLAPLDASTELVEQRACQFSAGKVFFEDLGDGEALTRGEAPARDLLRVKARTILGLLTS